LKRRFEWVGGGARECPVDAALPTVVPPGCGEGHQRQKKSKVFELAQIATMLCALTFWSTFLHWNNSKVEKSYCINGFNAFGEGNRT
jgi:hypothetical protein